ncbi:glycosyltransferase family 2 protein [Bacillus coahuilensis]|uniref:glycosyltransferase family 2 protein n=1 Tax=Bacillus coahuilensis TaxID=408580 RepID=UPI0001851255|nr:glycosyltransferase family 2 protein [Bacillus coahuilensis]
MTKKKFSILLPTLGTRIPELERLFDSLTKQTYTNFEVIIVSQGNHEVISQTLKKYSFDYQQIPIDIRGLSNARNVGMKHISGDYVTFSDDDCWYVEDALTYIAEQFENKKASILSFQFYDPFRNEYPKNYVQNEIHSVQWRDLFSKSSIEIFVDVHSVGKENIEFDTRFGLGAQYPSGEENIFLMDQLNRGHVISYIPRIIAYHEVRDGLPQLSYNMFISKGPLFKRMFNTPKGLLLFLALYAKKFNKDKRSRQNLT